MTEPKVGVIVIGRNEGERLKSCLASLRQTPAIVYVDSGSHDGSLEYARSQGIDSVALTNERPFTAARARNTGFKHLLARHSEIEFVQTIDGDCTMATDWLQVAVATLEANRKVATVFGRLRERHPDRSIFNEICDQEWNVPVGVSESCGGIAMHRASAFASAGGFNEALIAGEEPDLCLRLQRAGWSIVRIDVDMGDHDANILKFSQWWRRTVRAGFAYAEHVWRYRGASLRSWKRQTARFLFWGALLPAGALGLFLLAVLVGKTPLWATLPLWGYPCQFVRIWLRERGHSPISLQLAALAVVGKFAEAIGAAKFVLMKAIRRKAGLIEYK